MSKWRKRISNRKFSFYLMEIEVNEKSNLPLIKEFLNYAKRNYGEDGKSLCDYLIWLKLKVEVCLKSQPDDVDHILKWIKERELRG